MNAVVYPALVVSLVTMAMAIIMVLHGLVHQRKPPDSPDG